MNHTIIRKPFIETGYKQIVSTEVFNNLTFGLLLLKQSQDFMYKEEEKESVFILIKGQVIFKINSKEYTTNLRRDVFVDNPSALYVPKNLDLLIKAVTDSEIVVAKAFCTDSGSEYFIPAEKVRNKYVGESNWKRQVRDVVDSSVPAQRLIVGETINLPGCWSSWPPHKHDIDDFPNELKADELYHFRIEPTYSFALQRIYNKNIDESYVIRDGDTVITKTGYHPVVAAPGTLVYYIWVVSNEKRKFLPSTDPLFTWHKNVEFMLKEKY